MELAGRPREETGAVAIDTGQASCSAGASPHTHRWHDTTPLVPRRMPARHRAHWCGFGEGGTATTYGSSCSNRQPTRGMRPWVARGGGRQGGGALQQAPATAHSLQQHLVMMCQRVRPTHLHDHLVGLKGLAGSQAVALPGPRPARQGATAPAQEVIQASRQQCMRPLLSDWCRSRDRASLQGPQSTRLSSRRGAARPPAAMGSIG